MLRRLETSLARSDGVPVVRLEAVRVAAAVERIPPAIDRLEHVPARTAEQGVIRPAGVRKAVVARPADENVPVDRAAPDGIRARGPESVVS